MGYSRQLEILFPFAYSGRIRYTIRSDMEGFFLEVVYRQRAALQRSHVEKLH
jgi:hypothetical protein